MRLNPPVIILTAWAALAGAYLSPNVAYSQQIKATVVFHLDQLPKEEQDYLEGVAASLTREIDTYAWMEGGYNYEYPLQIELFFDKYSRSGAYRRYSAGVLIATRTGVQFRDTRWDFRYSRDFPLRMNADDDPFTSLISFYTWICLGVEMDGYSPLGGQSYYDKALATAENARYDINYVRGWDERRDFIRDLTLDAYRNIRTASFHVHAGLYYLEKKKTDSSRSHLIRAAELLLEGSPSLMELHRSDDVIRFVNARDLARALAEIGELDILNQLAKWDPDHAEFFSR